MLYYDGRSYPTTHLAPGEVKTPCSWKIAFTAAGRATKGSSCQLLEKGFESKCVVTNDGNCS